MNASDWKALVEAADLTGAARALTETARFTGCLTREDGARMVRLSLPAQFRILATPVVLDKIAAGVSSYSVHPISIEVTIAERPQVIRLSEHRSKQ